VLEDTIAAVAAGEGSVVIVRMTWPQAKRSVEACLWHPACRCNFIYAVFYGHVCDPGSGERVDEALLLLMRAPRSFISETVVELHCHGVLICVQRVLERLLAKADQGLLLCEDLRVAIMGLSNVGKSSLLNRLSRSEREIVTDLPGITHDLVESELVCEAPLPEAFERLLAVLRRR
jgi:tRNA U34 5-carboxymethylaminomethyl modifying GTPase MnmE/TrmE